MPRRVLPLRRSRRLAGAALGAVLAGAGILPVGASATASVPTATDDAAVTLDNLLHGPWASPNPSAAGAGPNASPGVAPASLTDTRTKPRGRAWAFPVREGTPISGTFGEIGTYWPGGHAGIDFDGDLGDPVFAAISGRVIYATFNTGGYGNLVITRRADGTEVRYAHLDRIGVDTGDWVRAGTRVGRMGATGQVTGVHLHLEVRVNDGITPTDPTSLWSGRNLGIPATAPAWSCAKYGGCAGQDNRSTGA